MRALIERYAAVHDIPEALLHRVIQRESDYRADARAGPYWGLMQILPQTARTMGFQRRSQ
jgi:soluble lytic murein transglycosylase-like protein